MILEPDGTTRIKIVKNVKVKDTPFKQIFYLMKDWSVLVEDVENDRSTMTNLHGLSEYINIKKLSLPWIRLMNNTYMRYENGNVTQLIKLFDEDIRFVNLTLNFGTTEVPNDNFEIENFKLHRNSSKDLIGTCILPIYKLYTMFSFRENLTGINISGIWMKIDNEYYRFPYGNIGGNDSMCGGNSSRSFNPEALRTSEGQYFRIITSEFNRDLDFCVNHNDSIPTTLDINNIKAKIDADNYDISRIDAVLYLSQCDETTINKKIFQKSSTFPINVAEWEDGGKKESNINEQ